MTSIHEKYAAARALYPDDIKALDAEEKQVKNLLEMHEYASLPITQRLLEMCRSQVLQCRHKLATDRALLTDPKAQADLWAIIDARTWLIQLLSKDFQAELTTIEQSLDATLDR
jgi:hypothetical protein